MADADERSARQHLEIIRQVQRDFTKRNALMKEIDAAIFLKKKPRVPRGFPNTTKVQSPLAPHIVNTITAALSMNPYKVLFQPVSIGPSGEQNARLRETFFNASWRRQEQERRARTFRNYMHGVVAYGEGVFKTVERTKTVWAPYDEYSAQLRTDLKDVNHPQYGDVARAYKAGDSAEHDRIYNARTEEKKRELLYPIRTVDVAPSTFFYIKGDEGFTYCCEEKYVPYYSTLERYGKGTGPGAVGLSSNGNIVPEGLGVGQAKWSEVMSGSRQLTMYEAWKWDECVYILCGPNDDISKGQGRIVKRIKDHGYGIEDLKTLRGPYFHSFGITTSSRELHLQGLSVIFGFLKLFPWLDELLTIQGAAAYQYGYPRYRRRANNGDTDDVRPHLFSRDQQDKIDKESVVEPGDILGIDIEPVESPSSGPDLGVAIKICRDLLELALPSIVQGAVDGTESGYLAAQATHLARLIWQPIVDNTQFCCEERTAFESWLIDEMIGEPVHVWGEEPLKPGLKKRKPRMMWLGLGPPEINGIHHYTVKLDPSTPSQDVIKVRTHDEMLKLKLESLDMAREDMGFNPQTVEQALMLEELKATLLPDIIAAAKAKILAKQQANAAQANMAETGGGLGGAANGRTGMGDVIQPGQNGEPLQPTPAGQAGVQNVNPAGGISSEGGGTPVVPSPAPPSEVVG